MLDAEAEDPRTCDARRGPLLGRASVYVGLALLTLTGCAQAPDPAFVDLARVQEAIQPLQPDGFPHNPPRLDASEATLEALAGGVLLTPDAQGRTEEAVQKLREQQERSHRRLLARLQAVYQAEVDRLSEQQRADLQAQLRAAEAALDGQARELFERTARQIGPLRVELARLAGHPDPDPRSLRSTIDPESRRGRDLARAAELRQGIHSIKEGFRMEIFALYEQVHNAYRQQMTEALAASYEIQALREIEAEAEAARWLLENQAFLPVTDLGTPIEAAAVAGAETRTPPSPPWITPTHAASLPVRGQDLHRLAKMFVSLRGYWWSDEPGAGADLTEEFISWKDRDQLGP